MSLVTRCPFCATAFRVQRAQLAARGGQVRCGKCSKIFDGVAGLQEEGARPAPKEGAHSAPKADPSPPPPAPASTDPDLEFELGSAREPEPEPAPAPRVEPQPQAEPESEPAPAHVEGPAESAPSRSPYYEAEPLPDFLVKQRPSRALRALWAVLALVALVALLAQATYRYRAELAAWFPPARAPLEAACRLLGCGVPLPRHASLIGIESSDLEADTRREGIMVLHALIRNRARFAQAYPFLELTLTDEGSRPVLRRVLSPADYLDAASAPQMTAEGIGPGGEAALRVNLDASRVAATGYRLYLFYP